MMMMMMTFWWWWWWWWWWLFDDDDDDDEDDDDDDDDFAEENDDTNDRRRKMSITSATLYNNSLQRLQARKRVSQKVQTSKKNRLMSFFCFFSHKNHHKNTGTRRPPHKHDKTLVKSQRKAPTPEWEDASNTLVKQRAWWNPKGKHPRRKRMFQNDMIEIKAIVADQIQAVVLSLTYPMRFCWSSSRNLS